jgi:hypothetical protein
MQSSSITKYGFRIRTRDGVLVENLSIFGQSEVDACRKLRQIYNGCEIIETHFQLVQPTGRHAHLNYEEVVDLIIAA